jgi:Domain of unknown function (DUF5011)/Secretion system C-terminal sorting domain
MKQFLFILVSLAIVSETMAQITTSHIGTTRYDLQTNNSIQRRVNVHPTTKDVIATFTASIKDDGAYDDRGTAYLFWNNATSQWLNSKNAVLTPPIDTFYGRIEAVRVGWPNPLFIGNKEVIMSHKSSTGSNGIYQSSRAAAGTGTWTDLNVTSGTETWPRAAASGNNIILVSSHFQAPFNEVDAGLMFIKSTDGGVNWSTPGVITGIDKDNYTLVGGDRYAIDLNGNNVALLTGLNDITLYKSADLGTTWTKKSIFPTSWNFVVDGEILDRADRSDGAFSVLIDNSNKVHCFWPRYVTFSDPGQGAGTFIDITRPGIMYWNEDMGNNPPKLLPNTDFLRESTSGPLSPINRFNTANQTLSYMGTGSGYRTSTTTWPSSGIDAAGNIYLSYAYNRGIIDTTPANTGIGKDADPTGYNLYDVYVMKSSDNGATWTGPTNVTSSKTLENTYPSMARLVDNHVHLVYQEDDLYGNAVMTATGSTNGTGSQSGPKHTRNKIFYSKIPVGDIINPTTDISNPTLRISNSFQNLVTRKNIAELKAVLFVGCSTDTVTGKPFSKTKSFVNNNFVEFSEDTSNLTILGLDTINTNVAGTRLIRITGKDAAGNPTLRVGTTFFDTLIMGIEIQQDITPPTINLLGANPSFVYLDGANFVDLGSEVSDNNPCTSASVNKSGTVDKTKKGTYPITYTAKDGANNETIVTRKVIVGVAPTAKITEEALSLNKITAKGSTSLDLLTEAGTSNTYKWTVKAGSQVTTIAATQNLSNLIIPTTIKSFDSLCLEVSNALNTAIVPNKPVSKECKFLKYGAGINSVSTALSIMIFPNPSNGEFNIKVEGNKENNARVVITSIDGKTISNSQVEINGNYIPFKSNLSKGSYFISTEVDGQVHLEKIEVR